MTPPYVFVVHALLWQNLNLPTPTPASNYRMSGAGRLVPGAGLAMGTADGREFIETETSKSGRGQDKGLGPDCAAGAWFQRRSTRSVLVKNRASNSIGTDRASDSSWRGSVTRPSTA